jgi:hypothetical protein
MNTMNNKGVITPSPMRGRPGRGLLMALAIGLSVLLTSCNVTRTVTTTSSSVKRGDTTVIIQSKTIESYDASKRL